MCVCVCVLAASLQVNANELTNGVINAAFMLLFKDSIRLFAAYNEGIINLLGRTATTPEFLFNTSPVLEFGLVDMTIFIVWTRETIFTLVKSDLRQIQCLLVIGGRHT